MPIGIGGALAIGSVAAAGIGAVASSSSASKAANASQNATNSNNALAADIYGQNKATLAPFVAQGGAATSYINKLLGLTPDTDGTAAAGLASFKKASGYDSTLANGSKLITNDAAVKGLLGSGSVLKALQKKEDDLSSGSLGTYLDRLSSQQGVGLSAASAQAGVANTYSSQVQGNNSTNATNQGNAAIAQGNAISNGVNGVANTASYLYGLGGAGGSGAAFNPNSALYGASSAFGSNGYVNGLTGRI